MERECYTEMAKLQTRHWWYEGRRKILSSLIADLPIPKHPKILEAGCGTGANLAMLSSFGKVYGFEPYAYAREITSQIPDCDIREGSLPHHIPFQEKFDLICALDVIEHIEQDLESLKALHNHLEEGRYAIFTVPAYPWLWSYHDEINHHKRRYTKSSLRNILIQSGYKIETMSYYNFFLFPVAVAVRFQKQLTGREKKTDAAIPRVNFVNDILREVFAFERNLLKFISLPFGLSLVAVCRKIEK